MSAPAGLRKSPIRNPQDFYGGLVLVAFAAIAFWSTRELTGSQGLTFGAGTAPRLFAGLLVVVGVIVTVLGLVTKGPAVGRYAIRGPLLVFASILVFAASVKPAGLVVATFVTVLVASASSPETRWREAIPWAAGLSVFCALLFSYGLGLPLALWPRW